MCVDYCGMLFSNIVSPVKLSQNDLTKLIVKYRPYAHSWREIGQNLGFTDDELKNIEARPNLLATAPKSYLSAMLSDWRHCAPGDARGSTITMPLWTPSRQLWTMLGWDSYEKCAQFVIDFYY